MSQGKESGQVAKVPTCLQQERCNKMQIHGVGGKTIVEVFVCLALSLSLFETHTHTHTVPTIKWDTMKFTYFVQNDGKDTKDM